MSPVEAIHRVREQTLRMRFRHDRAGWKRFDVGDGHLVAIPALRAAFEQRWPQGVLERAQASAAMVAAGRLCLLGRDWPVEMVRGWSPDLWRWDPSSAGSSPVEPAAAPEISPARENAGDAKHAWEINRLQCLHQEAALAIRSGDRKAGRAAVEVVLTWMEANPPFRGINWYAGIELALKLVSVAFAVAAAEDAMDTEARARIRALVAAHGFWLARFPSLYSSANNHRLAEALGLLVAGLLAPGLQQAPDWAAEGRRGLLETGRTLFHPDGIGVEQSPAYAAFALEMLALAAVLDRSVLTSEMRELLGRSGAALKRMLDDSGNAPRIGDDDEGRVVAMPNVREPRYVASVVAGLSGLLDRPDLAPPARAPHLRDLLFNSPPSGSPAEDGIHHFPDGGYTVVRETIVGQRAMLVFDHGPLGFLSIAAHGHADALAVWLHVNGIPVLVDAGTYLYSSIGGWREHFRSTAVHNTVVIGDSSQSLTAGPFNWRHKADTGLTQLSGGRDWSVTAEHDGYAKRFGVCHSRTVSRVEDGFTIEDRPVGRKCDLPAVGRFLVSPAFSVTLTEDGVVVLDDGRSTRVSLAFEDSVISADPAAPYSEAFGHLATTTALIFRILGDRSKCTVRIGLAE